MYDKAKADHAVNFINCLKHTKGQWRGVPFDLLPWQDQIIRDVFGTVKENGYRQYNTAYVEIPKKNGKALAIDTPIPTPDGWKLMRDLIPGDTVFDENGQPCHVVACTDIMNQRPCYEVRFSDDSTIIADEEHLWQTNSFFPEYDSRISTTKELAAKVTCSTGYCHRIVNPEPLRLPEKDLLIPPYVLGVWLADGNSYNASFFCNDKDLEIAERVKKSGVPLRVWKSSGTGSIHFAFGEGDRTQAARNDSWQAKMRKMNLFTNKHIPEEYLRASIKQRMALLQGLMDSDGYVSKRGQCEYTTVSLQLSKDVSELIRSLGMKCSVIESRATLRGKDCGPKYRIMFYSYRGNPVFSLSRKINRLKVDPDKPTRNSFRTIIEIKPVDSVPVKCIQVDSPSRLYLAGRSMVPTHNSELAAAIALLMTCGDAEWGAEVYGCASDRQQASIVFDVAVEMVEQSPALRKHIKPVMSMKRLVYKPTNSFYQVLSAEAFTKHGLNVHAVIFDELHAQPNRDLYDVMTKGSGDARNQPLFFLITTAGNDRNSICYEVHQKAKDILEGRKVDPSFYPVIYGIADDDDWADEANWYKANPSLGHTIDIEKVRIAFQSARENPAEENLFRQLRLNQWVKQSTRWMPMEKWDACGTDVDPESLKGRVCYGGLDLSSTTDVTAFVLLFPPRTEDENYIVLPHFWVPDENLKQRVRRDHVPYDIWEQQGHLQTTEGNVVHYGFIETFIEELGTKYNIKEIAFDRWGAVQMVQNLEGMGFNVIPFGQGYKDMSPPSKELMKLTLEEKIQHGNHPVLRWMMDNIFVKTDPAGNIKPDKEKSTERIDGAVALIMALDRAIRNEDKASVYEDRGILFL
ncbi:terminase TerL endonuclease subunit [Salisediminibacterium selenitireducens]|uniref:Terminase n=1 Tax=Bacillus selenitireducens (strain ATCC 700615 / DSM 15326 / MLS10) TaxID=439292 RepID=D6XZY9_BACIE|nr:terminase TerL endonuclease subunit [Salisediminibacterium selenitireducens]ADI00491.1 Terminase [[Bacillus] selenitireducens MLS10]